MLETPHSLLPAPERSRNIQDNDSHIKGKDTTPPLTEKSGNNT
jgi:hypothetical protein